MWKKGGKESRQIQTAEVFKGALSLNSSLYYLISSQLIPFLPPHPTFV
jgi:hypothetical protein